MVKQADGAREVGVRSSTRGIAGSKFVQASGWVRTQRGRQPDGIGAHGPKWEATVEE